MILLVKIQFCFFFFFFFLGGGGGRGIINIFQMCRIFMKTHTYSHVSLHKIQFCNENFAKVGPFQNSRIGSFTFSRVDCELQYNEGKDINFKEMTFEIQIEYEDLNMSTAPSLSMHCII